MARKRSRRGHKEGSIYQRKDGRWAASLTVEGRKRKTFYGKTRGDVAAKLNTALVDQQQGTLVTGKRQKLGEYLDHWLEEVKRKALKPNSYLVYRQSLDAHLLPGIGHIALQALTPQQVQRLYSELGKKLAPRTVHRLHTILHEAIEQAVKSNLVARNVCDAVELPRIERYVGKVLTAEQAKHLLDTAHGHWLEPVLWVALTTGMRRGEILGLHWDDINFAGKWLQVNRTVARVGKTGMQASTPKTAGSRRVIALTEETLDQLRKHQEQASGPIVFCASTGDYTPGSSLDLAFKRVLEQAGLPEIRFHDLRHSAASLLLGMGVHPKVVSEILGHSTIKMTMDTYSHVSIAMQQDAVQKMGKLFE